MRCCSLKFAPIRFFTDARIDQALNGELTRPLHIGIDRRITVELNRSVGIVIYEALYSATEAYEQRIAKMQQDTKVLVERINNPGIKKDTFSKTFQDAVRFLVNIYKM